MRSVFLAILGISAALSAVAAAEEPASADPTPAPVVEAAKPAPAQPAPANAAPDEQALRALVRNAALSENLPPEIAEAVADVESGFNPRAVGGVGEIGLMQVLPSTARMLGFSEPLPKLFEPETNVRYGVRYLSQAWRKTGEDICGTVMKYRAGHGETRYSQLSVAYCLRVRKLLADRGFKVTGVVPIATFGAPAALGAPRGVRRLANGRVRMAFSWRTVDQRRKALDRMGGAGLRIME